MENTKSEQISARIRNMVYSFKDSILFYPTTLSLVSIFLFLITSRIDDMLAGKENTGFNIPYIEWILFAGSPNAARSVLSTIATGWATVLSVAFSVTLIALQLSVTRHTSEVVNEFEKDKINQITLGWFIATVIYSLLVLKTVRTGENGIEPFTPIIGVNVSVLFAVVALFIFATYLNNISSYIKTRTLIDRIANQTLRSLTRFADRRVDRMESFAANNPSRKENNSSIVEIRSTQEGFLTCIDWDKIANGMSKHNLDVKIRIEWLIAIGDWVNKDSTIAVVRDLDEDSSNKKTNNMEDGGDNRSSSLNAEKIHHVIISSIIMGQKRSLSSDPIYGLEVLRNIAMKARNQSDINAIEACISGVFRILFYAMGKQDVMGLPFYLQSKKQENGDEDATTRSAVLMIPKEDPNMVEAIFLELSDIHSSCESNKDLDAVIRQFAKEYSAWSMNLLDEGKTEAFRKLTAWYSSNIKTIYPQSETPWPRTKRSSSYNSNGSIAEILSGFRQAVYKRHPYAVDTFDIYMRSHIPNYEA